MLRNGKFEDMTRASGCFVGSNPRYRSVPQQEIAGDVSRSLDALQHNAVLPLPGPPKGRRSTDCVLRMMHASGRSRFVLHEGATMRDLREKVHISTGVLGHLQKLACDANGLNPILAADPAPLSSVGLGHGTVIWLGSVLTASLMVSGTVSSHQGAKPVNTLNQQDFPTLQETLPAHTVQGYRN